MPVPKGFGRRLQNILLELQALRGERLTLAEFGSLVAQAESPPREKPYTPGTVSGWINEESEPTLSVIVAIAKISGKHPSQVAFGELPPGAIEEPQNYRRMEDVVAEKEQAQRVAEKHAPRDARKIGGLKHGK